MLPQYSPSPIHKGRPETKLPISVQLESKMSQERKHLSNILISDSTYLLDIGCTLRNILQRVSSENQLVFLAFRYLYINALMHHNPPDNLLANEIPDQPFV